MTKTLADLVRELEYKEAIVQRLRVVWVSADGRTAERKPLASLRTWSCYGVEVATGALLDLRCEFRDPERLAAGESADFTVRLHGIARIPDEQVSAQRAVERARSPEGPSGALTKLMRSCLEQSGSEAKGSETSDAVERKWSLLEQLLRRPDAIKGLLNADFYSEGVDVSEIALLLVSWHPGEVNLDEPAGLSVRTDADPVVLTVQGLLNIPDSPSRIDMSSQAETCWSLLRNYYTARSPRYTTGEEKGVKELAIEALRRALDGRFTRQQWIAERDTIDAEARAAVARAAARYGREVVQLTLLANVGPAAAQSINFDVTELYRITGVDRALKIQHRGYLTLVDDGTWQRSKRTDSRAHDIRELATILIREETERQLQKGRYNDAVKLLVGTTGGDGTAPREEQDLSRRVEDELNRQLGGYGFKAVQFTSVVQDLPERPLLRGVVVEVEPQSYELSVAGRLTSLGFRGRIQLVDAEQIVPYLSGGGGTDDGSDLIELVRDAIRVSIKAYVATISPNEYITSNLSDTRNPTAQSEGPSKAALLERIKANVAAISPDEYITSNVFDARNPTAQNADSSEAESLGQIKFAAKYSDEYITSNVFNARNPAAQNAGPSEAELLGRIKRTLREDFGIELSEQALRRGADPIVTRIYELQSRSFEVKVEGSAASHNTGRHEPLRLLVHGRIIGPSRHPEFMGIYSAKAARLLDEHIHDLHEGIGNILKQLLARLPYEFFLSRHFAGDAAQWCRILIEGLVETEQGLLFTIDEHGLRSESGRDVLEDESIANFDEHIATLRQHQKELVKRARDPDDLKVYKKEFQKYEDEIAWLQQKRQSNLIRNADIRRSSGDMTRNVLDKTILDAAMKRILSEEPAQSSSPARQDLSD